jgi:hypothetical protein
MDLQSWQATIGAGMRLKTVTQLLHVHGNRAISHGTCPDVGIGDMPRLAAWVPRQECMGSTLDHVDEVTVTLANSTTTVASSTQHSDLFFELKGAAASFGIITEFKVHTEPEPGEMV